MAEILSGGLNWGSTQQAIVTMDKEGHPLTCCNPVTGECLGGGGSSDFSTAEVTFTGSTTSANMYGACVVNTEDLATTISGTGAGADTPAVTLVLYKGKAVVEFESAEGFTISSINATGNAQEMSTNVYMVTGDCNFEILS